MNLTSYVFFETYLDSSFQPDDDNLQVAGYNMARADHPANAKRGKV